MYKDIIGRCPQETLFHDGFNGPNVGTFQKEHTKISDEKDERNKNWDKHSGKRPGSDEKKKDESRGWFRRKPPKKKKDQNKEN